MIKALTKIINSEIKKSVKKDIYKNKINTNTVKITSVTVGKMSY